MRDRKPQPLPAGLYLGSDALAISDGAVTITTHVTPDEMRDLALQLVARADEVDAAAHAVDAAFARAAGGLQ